MNSGSITRAGIGQHMVYLDKRKNAQISGVSEVCSFHENEIILRTDAETMVINGEGLHVGKLLLDEGKVEVTGRIDSLVYESPKVLRRLWWRKKSIPK